MKKFNTYIIICLITLSFIHCGRKFGIERFDRPPESPAVAIGSSNMALIRGLYCDIYLRQIKDRQWEKLLDNPGLKNPQVRHSVYRVPKVLFFETHIKNTWKHPIEIEKITIDYDKISKKSLTQTDLSMRYKSPLYKLFNFEEILKTRRVLGKEKPIDKVDFIKETIPYRLSFIPPGDRAMRIAAFEKPKARVRAYRITFHLKLLEAKKVIAFKIQRFEYRTRGKNFTRAQRKKNDED